MTRTVRNALLVGLTVVACGGEKKEADHQATADKPVDPGPAEPVHQSELPPLGVARPADLAYDGGKGARSFTRAQAAQKAKDWTVVRTSCEEAIAADPAHLEAHRLLASALAQQGAYEQALGHLAVALAGDWTRWGASVEADPDLEPIVSSPLAARMKEMVATYRAEFARATRAGLLVVARRVPFKEPGRPKKPGASARVTSRAEVFAYQLDTRRYLRLTQTGFQVLGFLVAPSGDELAYVAASQVNPGAPPGPGGAGSPPVLAAVQIGTVNLDLPETRSTPAAIKSARTLAVEYLPGDELVFTTYDPAGWWGLGQARSFTIDRATGKPKPTRAPGEPAAPDQPGGDPKPDNRPSPIPGQPAAPAEPGAAEPGAADPTAADPVAGQPAGDPSAIPAGRRLVVRYETVNLEITGDAQGVAADWNPETGTVEEFVIDASRKRIQLPAGESAARASLTWSPDRARLAFATAADPCAADPVDRQAAVYVVEAESGKLRHVYKGAVRLPLRFADPATVAFEDDQAIIRLYDAAVAREVGRLDNRPGQSFTGLGARPGILCKANPSPATPAPASTPAAPTDGAAPPPATP